VAAIASLEVINAGYQVAIMAPTEVLARQHFESFSKLFRNYDFKIGLVTSSYKLLNHESRSKNQEKKIHDSQLIIRNSDIIIGTHALIQKDVKFKKLALVIVDEQHRFGVEQRAYLQQKSAEINDGLKNNIPHFLTMTATPIPRTLALAFFGNLDLSLLDEMPKNRKKIITRFIGPLERQATYEFVEKEIMHGRQCFVILPLVEESKILNELKAAVQECERLSKEIFPNLNLGLLHGRLKSAEKEKVMAEFNAKKIDVLVATSVVEVGIDIPNATVMIIEDADRFGLSQLHQFRGRIGRSEHQSYCFLFSTSDTTNAKKRLKALVESNDGFKIAEEDLKLRGPGEFFGTRQSGLPDIAMENLTNVRLIQIARNEAQEIIRSDMALKKYPALKKALSHFEEKIHLE
jgi:ATP-dependent DNA helicase RecG